MPEIPDIQNFSSNLKKLLIGKKLRKIQVIKGKKLNDNQSKLSKSLEGASVKDIYRSGKELRFLFSNKIVLGMHLMLTGDIHFFEDVKAENKYKSTIVEFIFQNGEGIVLADRLGNANVRLNPVDKEGVDALDPKLNYQYLKKICNSRAQIKNLLIDQNLIRGIGNSYSDEILWETGISPFSIAKAIPDHKVKELAVNIKKVLKEAMKKISKTHPGILHGEVKEFLKIHTKLRDKSPTGAPIKTASRGMLKTYYTEEQVLYQ